MDGSDWLGAVIWCLAIVCVVGVIAVQVGQDLMLAWICTDNGYEGAMRRDGTRYCTYKGAGDVTRFVPLDSLVEDWEGGE